METNPKAHSNNRLPILAAEIQEVHVATRAATSESLARTLELGDRLLEAKALVGRGNWLSWLRQHCAFSEREARNYMRFAEHCWNETRRAYGGPA